MQAMAQGSSEQELAALRRALLAPEQAMLRRILARLDDPATRAKETADVLPAALALAGSDREGLVATLRPLMKEALAEALAERPDVLAGVCRQAMAQAKRRPLRRWGRRLAGLFGRRRKLVGEPRIEQLYIVNREDGALAARVEKAPDGEVDPADEEFLREQKNTLSMATFLLATLRDPVMLAKYAAMKSLRVERYVFGVHADDARVMLSVIWSPAGVYPEGELKRCDGMLEGVGRGEMPVICVLGSSFEFRVSGKKTHLPRGGRCARPNR